MVIRYSCSSPPKNTSRIFFVSNTHSKYQFARSCYAGGILRRLTSCFLQYFLRIHVSQHKGKLYYHCKRDCEICEERQHI